MKYLYLVCLYVLASFDGIFAQQENVWILGDYGLNVASTSPLPQLMNGTRFSEASASVCDGNGELLFYTDGSDAWDRFHNLMPNGSALTTLAANATGSSTQGACIVPIPGQENQYYIFSSTSLEFGADAGKLFYSKVDMSLNGGRGDVVANEKAIFLDEGFTEKMIAMAGSRCNVWVIARSRVASEFKSFEVTSTGVNQQPVVSPVDGINFNLHILGTLTPSPDNKKVLSAAAHVGGGGLELFDFNQATGVLSNPVIIDNSEPFYSACFSPDQSKVYAINYWFTGNVYQYSIDAQDPFTTKTLLRQGLGFAFDKIKLAANGKVYLKGGSNHLDAINFPNLPAPACGFTSAAISFDSTISGALPNHVPIFAPGADSLTSTSIEGPCWSNVHGSALGPIRQDGWDYVWQDGVTERNRNADTPGVYWVSYYTAPCNCHTDTFHVTFPNGVLPDIAVSAACKGTPTGKARATTYPGDPVGYSYFWFTAAGQDTLSRADSMSQAPAGAYRVHIATSTGCDTLLFFDIPEEDFRVSFEVSDTLICLGDVLELTNTSDTHFVRYHWAFDNGDTLVVQTPLPYAYPESGAYRLMLAGEGAVCKDTTYQTILVDQPILPDFKIEPEAVCVGQPIAFFPTTNSTTVQLTWDMEEQLRIEPDVQPRYQHSFESSGIFPVTLSIESRACPDTSVTDSIHVYPYPEVDLGTDSSICLHGQPVYLKNLREAPLSPYHQVWSTGDTTEVLKVVQPGVYTLSVAAEPMGCTTTESIEISKDCYIDIPNAFTPDGDGNNDYFLPRQLLSEGLTRFHMQVFNRWGQLLYETNRVDGRGWDGRFNGRAQPSGVYLYRIEAGFNHGRQENYEGNLTLLR